MASQDLYEFAGASFHAEMGTSPVAVFPAGTSGRIIGVVLTHDASAASHLVEFQSADGAIDYLELAVTQLTSIPVPIKWKYTDGLRIVCTPTQTDIHVTIFYVTT